MAYVNELLEYQKVDADLRKIEQEITASEERKKYVQAKKFMESAAEKLEAQDKRAQGLKAHAQKLTQDYEEITKMIAEYAELDEMVESGGDVTFYKKSVQTLIDRLHALKGALNKLTADVEAACDEYQKMKKTTISMQKQYREYSEKFKELKNSRSTEVNAINEKLGQLGAGIPAEIIAKYRTKRKERIFPVIAPLTDGRCICGMDLPIAQQGALSGGGVIECEHCHRFLYKA